MQSIYERGSLYSDRPPTGEFRQQAFSQWRLIAVETGERVHLLRRIYKKLIGYNQSRAVRNYQNYESMVLLRDLLERPLEFLDHTDRYSASVIFSVVYGVRVASLDHPVIKQIYKAVELMSKCGYCLLSEFSFMSAC